MFFCRKQIYCDLLHWWLLYIFQKQRDNWCIIENIIKKFKLTNEGGVNSYLGMNFSKNWNGTITTIQPAIIDKILNSLGMCYESKMNDTPENVILKKDEDSNRRNQEWQYRSVIGQKNHLSGTTRPDIIFAMYQCAKNSIDPKQSHKEAVKTIGRYLKRTRSKVYLLHSMDQMG